MTKRLPFLALACSLIAQPHPGDRPYKEECARCHGENLAGGEGAPTLRGPAFAKRYTLESLTARIQKTMPPEAPGRLSAQKSAAIAAYILGLKTTTQPQSNQQVDWPFYGGNAATQKYSPLDPVSYTHLTLPTSDLV